MHKVARPFFAFRFFILLMLQLLYILRPRLMALAIAPPLTFTFSSGKFNSFTTAILWAAKASFDSTKSKSLIVQPAFFMARLEDGIGPEPIKEGSTPQLAHETILANGCRPYFSACSLVITKTAAAPSLIPEEFPAVTVPLFLKAGLRSDSPSSVT